MLALPFSEFACQGLNLAVPTATTTGRHLPLIHMQFLQSTNLDFCTSLLVGHQLQLQQLYACFGSTKVYKVEMSSVSTKVKS